jgi:hypothetical protein
MTDSVSHRLKALQKLAREATNGWACYARTKREQDEIARLHREIDAIASVEGRGQEKEEKYLESRVDSH